MLETVRIPSYHLYSVLRGTEPWCPVKKTVPDQLRRGVMDCNVLCPTKRLGSLSPGSLCVRIGKLRIWDKFVQEMDLKWNSRGDPTSINNSCKGSLGLLSSAFYSRGGIGGWGDVILVQNWCKYRSFCTLPLNRSCDVTIK